MLDPTIWRARAEELRVIAEQFQSTYSRDQLLQIASDYDRLADREEVRRAIKEDKQ